MSDDFRANGAGKIVKYPKHILIKMTHRDFDALCAMATKRGQHRAEIIRAAFLAFLHEEERKEENATRIERLERQMQILHDVITAHKCLQTPKLYE